MIIPTVHLNGTSKAELIRQVSDTVEALDAAIRALEKTYPHGRDYYRQDRSAISEAVREFQARQSRLLDVRAELLELWQGIAQQPANRSEI